MHSSFLCLVNKNTSAAKVILHRMKNERMTAYVVGRIRVATPMTHFM